GETVFELLNDLKDFQFNACIYDKDTLHTLREDKMMIRTAEMNKLELIFDDFEGYRHSAVNKVLVTAEADEMDRIVAYYEQHPEPRNYKPARSADIRLEVIHPELSKSKGIAILLERLGFRADEVMTFGDMMNDFDMIRDYVGVAMGNADERIKAVAKYHTASNNEDGIGVFIEKNLLK
ncbi:MAG: HAD hydrolase family protein, partial [Solobacterium sp.]|nr:HAD hydrolase family protein [Solobacterium sp.]